MESPVGYQFPRSGNNLIAQCSHLCSSCTSDLSRAYLRNRLKIKLETGKSYCVKFYVNISNNSTYGIDGFGAYFGDELSLDTIKKFAAPLVFLIPQVQNPLNNIIADTLKWSLITGTFVANGLEKFMVIGNFKADSNTNKAIINTTYLPTVFTDVCVDDVSCIEVNLPAYAGTDKSIISGDSVYIGRESDFAIDPGCIWYKLPNTTTAIDTSSGLWVKPTSTTTYVVKQVLDCSPEKWDTVVVYINMVGLDKLKILNKELTIFPVPAKDELQISIRNTELIKDFHSLSLMNNLGLLIREEELKFENGSFKIKTDDLPNGVYSLQLENNANETVIKRFVISR